MGGGRALKALLEPALVGLLHSATLAPSRRAASYGAALRAGRAGKTHPWPLDHILVEASCSVGLV